MTTYKDAGVDIEAGDAASKAAYNHAASTFASRKGMVAAPVFEEDGYGGLLDMGDYYLVQSTDSTGTKIDIAAEMGKYDTLGYDLLAMVADDVVCVGAEVVSVSNCIDVPKVDAKMIDSMMSGLAKACSEQKIVVPAGEIAEVPGAVHRAVWSSSAIGIVKKDRVMNTKFIQEGDVVLTLQSGVARSNGFSLLRKILTDVHGEKWHQAEWKDGTSWGEILLTPSVVYHAAVLELIGRFDDERKVHVKAISHITGGGIPSKLRRVLKASGLGAELTDLFAPHQAIQDVITLGNVPMEEAYRTWNMGNGMMLILDSSETETAIQLLGKQGIKAKVAGIVTKESTIELQTYTGEKLRLQ